MALQLPEHFKPTHQTSGLPGFPAVDCFAPAGTPVLAPCAGRVVKLSGHPPIPIAVPGGPYGWSIYVTSPDGTRYLTHFGHRAADIAVGRHVKRGQLLGWVANYAAATHGVTPSHIHYGFHAGAWHP